MIAANCAAITREFYQGANLAKRDYIESMRQKLQELRQALDKKTAEIKQHQEAATLREEMAFQKQTAEIAEKDAAIAALKEVEQKLRTEVRYFGKSLRI